MYYAKNLAAVTVATIKDISNCLYLAADSCRFVLKRHFQGVSIVSRTSHKCEACLDLSDIYYLAGLVALRLVELDDIEILAVRKLLGCLCDEANTVDISALKTVLCRSTVRYTPSEARS